MPKQRPALIVQLYFFARKQVVRRTVEGMTGVGRKKQDVWVCAMVLTANDNRCTYCGCQGPWEMDHVIPFTRGGADNWTNLVPACEDCNKRKNAKTPIEWAVEAEFRERWPLRTRKRSSHTLRGAFEETQQVCSELLDHLDRVQAEIADKARSDWFFDRLWVWGKPSSSMTLPAALGWSHCDMAEAKANGWPPIPKPKPKRYRIDRTTLGQLLVEVPDGEDSVEGDDR